MNSLLVGHWELIFVGIFACVAVTWVVLRYIFPHEPD